MERNKKAELSSLTIDRSKKLNDGPKSRKWLYLFWVIIIIAVVIGYFSLKEKITPATKVKVATAKLITGSEAKASLVATGYVVAQRKAEVASKATGRIKYLGFEEGDTILSGEIIAELENDDIKANLELAKANLLKAEADSLNTDRNYQRQVKLFKSGSIAETLLEDAETSYKLANASVTAASAKVKAAEVDLENTYIKAPFSGTVLSKNADVGEIVAPFASSASSKGSVVTLADMNSLEIEADVSESNIYKVLVGQKCDIILDAYPNNTYPGEVKKIVPTADRTRATVLTKIKFIEKDSRVLPEMSARVNFFETENQLDNKDFSNVIAVPQEAITSRNNQKIVFKINDNYVVEVQVQEGRKLGNITEILRGLNPGDQVVLSPPGKMSTGQKVEITH